MTTERRVGISDRFSTEQAVLATWNRLSKGQQRPAQCEFVAILFVQPRRMAGSVKLHRGVDWRDE